jgi:flagellar protein FliJ
MKMSSRDTLARLRRLQIDETSRRIAQLEAMIAEFSKMAGELEREISAEEQKAGVFDLAHFAYPTYARAAHARRDNLRRSAEELTAQLETARRFLEESLSSPGKPRECQDNGTAQLAS